VHCNNYFCWGFHIKIFTHTHTRRQPESGVHRDPPTPRHAGADVHKYMFVYTHTTHTQISSTHTIYNIERMGSAWRVVRNGLAAMLAVTEQGIFWMQGDTVCLCVCVCVCMYFSPPLCVSNKNKKRRQNIN
jgi:hypothetical protein